jgi:hypothetical protein
LAPHVQSWIIICRTDANAAADARFDPADPASDAGSRQGKETAGPSVANQPVKSEAGCRGKAGNFSPKFAAKAARRAEELEAVADPQFSRVDLAIEIAKI